MLRDPTIDCAVLETARGGILREGLGWHRCDVGAVLKERARSARAAFDRVMGGDVARFNNLLRDKGLQGIITTPPSGRTTRGRTGADPMQRIPVVIAPDHETLARDVAHRIASLVRARTREGRPAVLGLATGSTPIGVYRELVRLHREEGLSFAGVVTFNLDEYYPMAPEDGHSYHRFIWENLFSQIDIPAQQVHLPRGDLPRAEVEAHCAAYEAAVRAAGGIDFQIGLVVQRFAGKTGIGFKRPAVPPARWIYAG